MLTTDAGLPLALEAASLIVITVLRGSNGASIANLCNATGSQAHSVCGALSGAIKKRLALAVTSEKFNGVCIYRVAN